MLSRSLFVPASALLASLLALPVNAQLYTSCNPLNATCSPDPAFGTKYNFQFNSTPPAGVFNMTAGTVVYSPDLTKGATFALAKRGDSPTLISNFYFFFGRTEVHLKAASGQGVISSIVWSSDVLDEVDWEFMGGNDTHASTNYFGKGRMDFLNAGYHPVTGGVQSDFHNYTSTWTKDQLNWYIDGKLIRTLNAKDANNTNNYPQTPMKLSMGIWAGGDPSLPKGTIEWAGGETDFTKGPYTMYVKSAAVEDYSSGKEYTYGDKTGSWQSIKIATGNSTAVENINREPEKSLSQKWDALPSTTKIGIYAAAGGVGALALMALIFYYCKQKRRGAREAAIAAKAQEADRMELERFKKEGRNPDALAFDGADYDAASMRKDGMTTPTMYNIPDSRNNSLHSAHAVPDKMTAWDPTASGAVTPGMRSNMPLLHDNVHSPRLGSPGPQGFNAPSRHNSPGPQGFNAPSRHNSPGPQGFNAPARNNSFGPMSPAHSHGSGMPPAFPPPNAPMRMGSPASPSSNHGAYSGMDRTHSPAPMHPPSRGGSARPDYNQDYGYGGGGGGGYGGYR